MVSSFSLTFSGYMSTEIEENRVKPHLKVAVVGFLKRLQRLVEERLRISLRRVLEQVVLYLSGRALLVEAYVESMTDKQK